MKPWLSFSGISGLICGSGIVVLQGWVASQFGSRALLSLYVGAAVAFLTGLGTYAWLLSASRKAVQEQFRPVQAAVMGGMLVRMAVVAGLGWLGFGWDRLHGPAVLISFLGFTLALLALECALLYRRLMRG